MASSAGWLPEEKPEKPIRIQAGRARTFYARVEIDSDTDDNDIDEGETEGTLTAQLTLGGEPVASKQFEIVDGDTFGVEQNTVGNAENNDAIALTHVFEPNKFDDDLDEQIGYPRTDSNFRFEAEIVYENDPPGVFRSISTTYRDVKVEAPGGFTTQPQEFTFGENNLPDSTTKTYQDRIPFSIQEIEYENDAVVRSIYSQDDITNGLFEITDFDYPNPSIAIDGAGRFVKHEIIGGATVRQKVGDEPINITVDGVCKRRKANQIDSLSNARVGKMYSDRMPNNNESIRVQFGSTSTEPLSDGGAADFQDGQLLYSFSINAIEVIR